MGNLWKCSGKCSRRCSGKSGCSEGCSGGCSGNLGVPQGVLPRVLFPVDAHIKSTPWSMPNSPEHPSEHPISQSILEHPLGALPRTLPEHSQRFPIQHSCDWPSPLVHLFCGFCGQFALCQFTVVSKLITDGHFSGGIKIPIADTESCCQKN